MSDLIKRLRSNWEGNRAADRIEQLETELAEAKQRIKELETAIKGHIDRAPVNTDSEMYQLVYRGQTDES